MLRKTEVQSQVVIIKIQKMLLEAALLNIQHYNVRIKGKVEQSRKWSRALPLHLKHFFTIHFQVLEHNAYHRREWT